MAKSALGRGFGALMGGGKSREAASSAKATGTGKTASAETPGKKSSSQTTQEFAAEESRVLMIPVNRVYSNARLQPRKFFETSSLDELAQSIREQGILQPLIVRQAGEGFELIAGERRLRAGKLAGLKEVPAVIRKADDRTVLELMLVENLQREDLNPIDEARGFEQLIQEFELTQESAASRVGKGRVVVANALRLLKLPQSVQLMVADGRLSVGHAKAILSLELFEDMQILAERVIAGKLSVRETEALVARKLSKDDPARKKQTLPLNVHLKKIEEKLRETFGTQVKVKSSDGGKGSLEIQFYSKEDLNRLLDLFSVQID